MTNKNTSTYTSDYPSTSLNSPYQYDELVRTYVITNKFSKKYKLIRSPEHITQLAKTLHKLGVMGKYDKLTQLTNCKAIPFEIERRVMYERLEYLAGRGSEYADKLAHSRSPKYKTMLECDAEELLNDVALAMWQYATEVDKLKFRYKGDIVDIWMQRGRKAVDKFVNEKRQAFFERCKAQDADLYVRDADTGIVHNITEEVDELADPYWRMQMLDYNNNSQRLIDAVMNRLTVMDQEILRLRTQGYSNRQIADKLRCDEGTVRNHLKKSIKQVIAYYERAYTALQAHRPH